MARKEPWTRRKWGGAPWWGWVLIATGVTAAIIALVIGGTRSIAPIASSSAVDQSILTTPDELPPLQIPDAGVKITAFGDSWTQGYSATPETLGYAYLTIRHLGGVANVLGAGGTGYNNPGTSNSNAGTYEQRLNALPVDADTKLLILQGGLNDLKHTPTDYGQIVSRTIGLAKRKFPNAQVVVVGPAPSQIGEVGGLKPISQAIWTAANDNDVYYVPPIDLRWINSDNISSIIDPTTKHPSTQGHATIATDLEGALAKLAQGGSQALFS